MSSVNAVGHYRAPRGHHPCAHPVQHEVAHGIASNEDRVERPAHAGQRVAARDHRGVYSQLDGVGIAAATGAGAADRAGAVDRAGVPADSAVCGVAAVCGAAAARASTPGYCQQLDRVAQFSRVAQVLQLNLGNSLVEHVLDLHIVAEGDGGEQRQLVSGIVAVHIGTGVLFGIAQRLRH